MLKENADSSCSACVLSNINLKEAELSVASGFTARDALLAAFLPSGLKVTQITQQDRKPDPQQENTCHVENIYFMNVFQLTLLPL